MRTAYQFVCRGFFAAFLISTTTFAQGTDASSPAEARPPGLVERDVEIGEGDWAVQGVLTFPEGEDSVPAVVLMHGSGPGTKDGDVGPNKIFREMAWGLAARGIAVLRYDKRTTAHMQRFQERGRAATMDEEHIDDGVAAVRVLQSQPGIGPVYILASSQSTSVAADVAAQAGGVAGIILSGVGARSPLEMIIDQTRYVDSLATANGELARAAEARHFRSQAELILHGQAPDTLTLFGNPVAYWESMDPNHSMQQTERFLQEGGRLLVVHGGRDYLTSEADIAAWENRLSAHDAASFRRYPDLNHMMQTGVGKMTPEEYNMKMEVSTRFLEDVARWMRTGS